MKEKLIIRRELERCRLTVTEAAEMLHVSEDDLMQVIAGGYEPDTALRGRIERLLRLPLGALSSLCATCADYGSWCADCNRS